jgi:hypothetical protein
MDPEKGISADAVLQSKLDVLDRLLKSGVITDTEHAHRRDGLISRVIEETEHARSRPVRRSRLTAATWVAALALLVAGAAVAGLVVGRSPGQPPSRPLSVGLPRVSPSVTATLPATAPPTPDSTSAPVATPTPRAATSGDALATFRANILPDVRQVSLAQNEAAAVCGSPAYPPCYSALTNRAVAIQTLLHDLDRFPSPPSAAQGISDLRAWTSALIQNRPDARTLFDRAGVELGFAVY